MDFWTSDINDDDVPPPQEIMKEAADELEHRNGKLTVSIDESVLADRVVFAFMVGRQDIGARINLFEISHRPVQPYPALITPPARDLPEFLREDRYIPGSPGLAVGAAKSIFEGTPGKYVKNQWVCATPSDVRGKLRDLFSKNDVRSRIVSLLARRANDNVGPAGAGNGGDDDVASASDETA